MASHKIVPVRKAAWDVGHQAARSLHLANIAFHKKTRAALAEDGKTGRV